MPEISYLKLLVPTAGPAPAMEKADYIMKLATRLHAEILALHIVKNKEDKAKCDQGTEALQIFEQMGIKYNIKVNTFLVEGELIPTIIKYAEDNEVDLIVMGGSEDGKMIADWIFSDLRYQTDLPVVIAPPGFVTITDEI